MRTLRTIDYSEARRAVELIVEKATAAQKSVVVAVADAHGELIAFARMDGAPASSVVIAMNKAWTAVRGRKSTHEIGERVRHPEKGHDIAYYGDPKFVGWGGGVPVWKDPDAPRYRPLTQAQQSDVTALFNNGRGLDFYSLCRVMRDVHPLSLFVFLRNEISPRGWWMRACACCDEPFASPRSSLRFCGPRCAPQAQELAFA